MKLPLLALGQMCSNALVYSHGLPKGQIGIMLKVISRTFDIRILWGHTLVPIGRKKGDNKVSKL